MNVLIFILILGILVFVHELGHFLAAKSSKIRVDEFAIGFPPRIFSWKKGETDYALNLLPFGGYVKIHGENPDDESLHGKDKKRSMANKPAWVQAKVLVAGVFFNFLLAWLLLAVAVMLGTPTVSTPKYANHIDNVENRILFVADGSVADEAGLEPGLLVIELWANGLAMKDLSTEAIRGVIESVPESTFEMVYLDFDNQEQRVTLDPELTRGGDIPQLGLAVEGVGTLRLPVHLAIWDGLTTSINMTGGIAVGFVNLIADAFRGDADINTLSGPVGLVGQVADASNFGFSYLLSFAAFISLSLAVLNLFPFPALDGGRLLFLVIEKIKGSRINPKVANTINAVGFFLLIGLMLLVTVFDVIKLF